MNILDPDIKFTTEGEEEGALVFLDSKYHEGRWFSEGNHLPEGNIY